MSGAHRRSAVSTMLAALLFVACTAATDQPAATDPPGRLPSPDPGSTATPAQPDPPDDPTEISGAGTWSGTVTGATGSQGLRFVLRDIGGVISGTAQWEHGRIHTGLRGEVSGDTLTLVHTPGTGNLVTTYEGTIDGDTFTGTVTDMLGEAPAPAGPSDFEVTRDE